MKLCVHAYVASAVATAGVVGGAYAAYRVYKRLQMARLPQKWDQVGTLKDIYIYPIKSCGGVMLNQAECSILGLKDGWLRDRVLMVTDAKNNFVTARVYPDLLKIGTAVKGSILTLTHANFQPLNVNLAEIVESGIPAKTAHVWSVPVPVYDCGWQASEWISQNHHHPRWGNPSPLDLGISTIILKCLESNRGHSHSKHPIPHLLPQLQQQTRIFDKAAGSLRLVYYAANKSRLLRSKNKFDKFTKNDTGALPDETSFNLINQASVDNLNSKLKDKKVSPCNFRPNFVLTGAQPFIEDNYNFVKIGENIFEVIKPCLRCILTTIDPETGVRDPESEPLETLRRYRQIEDPERRFAFGNSPRMGLQLALRSGPGGRVAVNEPVYFG